ncbi:phosphoribosyltransferase [Nodosilinea sp. LEGE 07088]|uniref:phosphoribosyltransferase n=1 Tax=Nodosilinea sp. LEGE 07088 TaxID=2777968 RepID=UPI0018818280|nr:phosphoribosyltransferase [Nodosilinea sp. LEGE 07088]MBE9140605.1 phosphoribosyltransferase [Nodosilinea sp. LEGE 07088]
MPPSIAPNIIFQNRTDAGRQLADRLQGYANRPDVLVLGLPRGGVPVAYEVAQALHAPLDVCLVRKLGVPEHKELALGAIASGGVRVFNYGIIHRFQISIPTIATIAAQEQRELERRDRAYRGDRPLPQICDRTVILVDDGIATGATMRAAIAVIAAQQPAQLVVATPVAAPATCEALSHEVDEVVCVTLPESLNAIGYWYEDFSPTTDADVRQLLATPAGHGNGEFEE